MTRRYHSKYLLALPFVFLLTACEGLFIQDPIDPRLPKYTETGNAVAGAFVNGEVWKSIVTISVGWTTLVDNDPVFYTFQNDSLVIALEGSLGSEEYFLLQFSVEGKGINSYHDLLKLNNTKIPLDGNINKGMVNAFEGNESCQTGRGQLYIKSVKRTPESDRVIFSGTFGFTLESENCETIKVEYGRFDYRVGEDNFQIGF